MDLENSSSTVNIMTENFAKYISDMKQNTIYMQEMINSGQKLQSTLKSHQNAQTQFLESFRKATEHIRNLYLGTGSKY